MRRIGLALVLLCLCSASSVYAMGWWQPPQGHVQAPVCPGVVPDAAAITSGEETAAPAESPVAHGKRKEERDEKK